MENRRQPERMGTSLDQFIREKFPAGIELRDVVDWTDQLADALDRLHAEGHAHGSIDPQHVFLDNAGRARLSPGYAGRIDEESRRDDLAGLAATCYVALAGTHELDRFEDILAGDPAALRPLAAVSNQINAALRSALLDTTSSPPRAREFVQTLQGAPVRQAPPVVDHRVPARRRSAAPVVFAGVVALAAGAVWMAVRAADGPAAPAPTEGQGALARPEATAPLDPQPPDPSARAPSAAETRWRRADAAASELRYSNNPALVGRLDDARRHAERAREAEASGRLDDATLAYEAAAASLAEAVDLDAQIATVDRLAGLLDTQLEHARASAELPVVSEALTEIGALVSGGRSALAEGAVSQADEVLRAARMRLNGLSVLEQEATTSREARDRWDESSAKIPDVVAASIRERLDDVVASAEAAREHDTAGRYDDARTTWDRATLDLMALIEEHDAARCAADEGLAAWQEARQESPQRWTEAAAVQAALARAETEAREAGEAMEAGRFDEAGDAYAQAAEAYDDALRLHGEHVTTRGAALERAATEGRFADALALVDEIEPFVDADWITRRRIDLHLERARRATRAEREKAMQSIEAVLAVEPDHPQALKLRDEIAELFAPRRGDELVNSIDQTLVYLAPGEFVMGRADGGSDAAHPVRLTRGFWMSRTEVTRGQFATFARVTGYRTDAEQAGWAFGLDESGRWRRTDDLTWRDPGFEQTDDHPVVCVSHRDAAAFCRWLAELEQRPYRLPTEAEWEFACRAGTTTVFSWGDEPALGEGRLNAADTSWCERFSLSDCFPWSDGYVYTSPAGAFRANPWGLHGLHGSAQEWCADRYGPYPGGGAVDPAHTADESGGSSRVIRGGSFAAPPSHCRADHRDASTPTSTFVTYGFRVVLEEPGR